MATKFAIQTFTVQEAVTTDSLNITRLDTNVAPDGTATCTVSADGFDAIILTNDDGDILNMTANDLCKLAAPKFGVTLTDKNEGPIAQQAQSAQLKSS